MAELRNHSSEHQKLGIQISYRPYVDRASVYSLYPSGSNHPGNTGAYQLGYLPWSQSGAASLEWR